MDKRGNISSRNMRLFAAIMTLIEALVLISLAGCAGKKVDYGTDTEKLTKSAVCNVKDFSTDETYSDEFSVQTEIGNVNIDISAKVELPDCKTMSVVEVEKIPYSAKLKEKVLKAYFGESQIYYYDKEHWTKTQLQNLIDSINSSTTPTDTSGTGNRAEFLKEYTHYLENAGDEWTIATEYDSCDEFVGKKGNTWYNVNFVADGDENKWLSGIGAGPIEGITQTFQDDDLKDKADETSNEGSKSAASAKKEVGDFLSKLGMQDLVERGECECSWIGFNNSEEGNDYQTAVWGYIYSYATGIDGITFKDGFDMDTYLSGYEAIDSDIDDVTLPDSTLLTVTDDGIIDVQMEYPVNVTQIYKDVELISLKNIEQIIKAEITENPDKYDIASSFNKLQLSYLKIRSDSEQGKYSYVPAWALSRLVDYSNEQNAIFVNAIDGTIIRIDDLI